MRVEIRDKEALSRLSLIDIRGYLVSLGWKLTGSYGDVATVFEKTDGRGREFELLLPKREELADYAERIADVVATLSSVEGREQLSIYYDLVKSGFDVMRFRASEADEAGTIALENGVALYDHARDLIAAAANAAIKPKRAYRGNSPTIAKNYVDSLRLGQTEVGSYILTVVSPVPPALESDQLPLLPELGEGEEPFPRTVTRTLVRALRATKHAVTEATATGRIDPFEAAIQAGVSANLCEAIAQLVENGTNVDISVSWSRVRPAPEATSVYVFTRDNARILTEAATTFREQEPQSDTTIEGFVIGLNREPQEFDGKAKIRGFFDGQIRTLTAQFNVSDYRKVVEAHDKKLRVRVDGDVLRRGPFQYLENARNLIIFEDDEFGPGGVLP